MKKTKILAIYFMAVVCLFCLSACNGVDDDEVGTNDNPALSVSDQKKELEATAKELIDKVNSDDFQNIADMVANLENNDDDVVKDWFDDCVEACKISGSTNENLKKLYVASNFTGKFDLKNGHWERVGDADDLQFTFNDKNGKTCVLKAETSGKLTTVHHNVFDEKSYSHHYETITKNSIAIPEKIHVTLSQGGVIVSDVTVNTSAPSGDFDFAHDSVQVTVVAKINSYNLNVSKIAFNAGTSASTSGVLSKGDETLIEYSASATGQLLSEDADPEGKTGEFIVKILSDKLRVEGNISNISSFFDYIDQIYEYREDESKFKRYIDKINNLLDVYIFFDDSKNSSAKMKLYPISKGDYYKSWDYEVCVVFDDGSMQSYDEYFDDVIAKFDNLYDDFVRMFD